jgi:hypothetical protein
MDLSVTEAKIESDTLNVKQPVNALHQPIYCYILEESNQAIVPIFSLQLFSNSGQQLNKPRSSQAHEIGLIPPNLSIGSDQ